MDKSGNIAKGNNKWMLVIIVLTILIIIYNPSTKKTIISRDIEHAIFLPAYEAIIINGTFDHWEFHSERLKPEAVDYLKSHNFTAIYLTGTDLSLILGTDQAIFKEFVDYARQQGFYVIGTGMGDSSFLTKSQEQLTTYFDFWINGVGNIYDAYLTEIEIASIPGFSENELYWFNQSIRVNNLIAERAHQSNLTISHIIAWWYDGQMKLAGISDGINSYQHDFATLIDYGFTANSSLNRAEDNLLISNITMIVTISIMEDVPLGEPHLSQDEFELFLIQMDGLNQYEKYGGFAVWRYNEYRKWYNLTLESPQITIIPTESKGEAED